MDRLPSLAVSTTVKHQLAVTRSAYLEGRINNSILHWPSNERRHDIMFFGDKSSLHVQPACLTERASLSSLGSLGSSHGTYNVRKQTRRPVMGHRSEQRCWNKSHQVQPRSWENTLRHRPKRTMGVFAGYGLCVTEQGRRPSRKQKESAWNTKRICVKSSKVSLCTCPHTFMHAANTRTATCWWKTPMCPL